MKIDYAAIVEILIMQLDDHPEREFNLWVCHDDIEAILRRRDSNVNGIALAV